MKPQPRQQDFVGRPPDFTVGALDKTTDVKGTVGVAWNQEDGRIRIKLNPFVVLDTFKQDLVLTLFPNDRKVPYAEPAEGGRGAPPY